MKPLIGKATQILGQFSHRRAEIANIYRRAMVYENLRPSNKLSANQIRLFLINSRGWSIFGLGSPKTNLGKVRNLIKMKGVTPLIREGFRRRNNLGISNVHIAMSEISEVPLNALINFFKRQKIELSRQGMQTVLASPKLREGLINEIAKTVSPHSNVERREKLWRNLLEEVRKLGEKKPLIVDYGSGEGKAMANFSRKLQKHGFEPEILATDMQHVDGAKETLEQEGIKLFLHDLRSSPLLKGERKADIVILGYVLPYSVREKSRRIIRHAMADLRIGGLLAVANEGDNYYIFKKINETDVNLIATNPDFEN